MRRDQLAAVCDQRVEARHLQRRHEQVLLADRELDRVARLPQLVDRRREVRLPPFGSRQETLGFGADVDAGVLPEAESARPSLQRMAALRRQQVEVVAQLVEVRVARVRERGRQVHRLVHVGIPVLEHLVRPVLGRRVAARARQQRVRRDQMFLHRRDRCDRLERRARRIPADKRALERGIVARRCRRLSQPCGGEPLRRDAAREDRRVVRGRGGEREDRSVLRIKCDECTAVRVPAAITRGSPGAFHPKLERLLSRALEVDVDRQTNRAARVRLYGRLQLAARIPERVDAELRLAWTAT